MKITILENNNAELKNLLSILNEWSSTNNTRLTINTYQSSEELLENDSNCYIDTDIFLLDIEMGNISGLELAKILRMNNYTGFIIFLTAFKDYVFEGYNVHAFNFFVKPINKSLLFQCLDEIKEKMASNFYTYKNKNKETRFIPFNDIIFFLSNSHYTDITTSKAIYSQYASLKTILNTLPRQFIQVHKSCIVNMDHIYKISKNKIYLSNGSSVAIGRLYLAQFKKTFLNYSTRISLSYKHLQ